MQDDTLLMSITSNCTFHPQGKSSHGFTLIELMVVVALVAILAALAAPSWTQLQMRNTIRTAVNDFTSSLYLARAEAVRLNVPVTVCPSTDGATCTATEYQLGWIVRTGNAADANQMILQDVIPRRFIQMDATVPAARNFTFLPNGRPASNFNGATVEVCPDRPDMDTLVRQITINRTGRITLGSPDACAL
jgi:type IV fimbrial biogenesis protein FimT